MLLVAIIESGGRQLADDEDRPEYTEALSQRDPERGGPSDFIPDRITRRDLERIRGQLDPEPWQQAILDTIHDDYLEAWTLEVLPFSRRCSESHASVFSVDPQTMRRIADIVPFRDAYAHAREGAARAAVIENRFFDDLAVALNEEQQGPLLRARLARALDRCLRGTDPFFSPAQMAFRPANVIEVLDDQPLSKETSGRVDEYLLANGSSLIEAALEARDIRMASELGLHELNIRMSEGMASGALTSADHGAAYRRLSDEMSTNHGEAMSLWKNRNESFRNELRTLLTPEEAAAFDEDWDAASNPIVYRDSNSATPAMEQALALADLNEDQREVLGEILAEYRGEWSGISREMASVRVEMSRFGANTPPDEYDGWQALSERYRALEFQRDETSLRALRRLSRYLEPDQRARIRALRRIED